MPTEQEFNVLMEEMSKNRKTVEVKQQTQQKAVGIEMSNIKNDPRWKVYEDHVLVLMDRYHAYQTEVENNLRSDMALGSEEILKLRTRLHGHTERLKGYREALDIVDQLIVKGNIAKGELDAETSGTH